MTNTKHEGNATVCTSTDNIRQRVTELKALNTLRTNKEICVNEPMSYCYVTGTKETGNNDLQIKRRNTDCDSNSTLCVTGLCD